MILYVNGNSGILGLSYVEVTGNTYRLKLSSALTLSSSLNRLYSSFRIQEDSLSSLELTSRSVYYFRQLSDEISVAEFLSLNRSVILAAMIRDNLTLADVLFNRPTKRIYFSDSNYASDTDPQIRTIYRKVFQERADLLSPLQRNTNTKRPLTSSITSQDNLFCRENIRRSLEDTHSFEDLFSFREIHLRGLSNDLGIFDSIDQRQDLARVLFDNSLISSMLSLVASYKKQIQDNLITEEQASALKSRIVKLLDSLGLNSSLFVSSTLRRFIESDSFNEDSILSTEKYFRGFYESYFVKGTIVDRRVDYVRVRGEVLSSLESLVAKERHVRVVKNDYNITSLFSQIASYKKFLPDLMSLFDLNTERAIYSKQFLELLDSLDRPSAAITFHRSMEEFIEAFSLFSSLKSRRVLLSEEMLMLEAFLNTTSYTRIVEELENALESILKSQAFSRRIKTTESSGDDLSSSVGLSRLLSDVVEELDLVEFDNRKKVHLLSLLTMNDSLSEGLRENYLVLRDLLGAFSNINLRQDFKRSTSDRVFVLSKDLFRGDHIRALESLAAASTDQAYVGLFDNDRILLTAEAIYDEIFARKNPSRVISIKLETNLSTRDLL